MAKWTSTAIEVLHEVGRNSSLGSALVSLVENGKADYQVGNVIERHELEDLQPEFTLVGLALAGCIEPGCQIMESDVETVCYAFQNLRGKFNDLLSRHIGTEVDHHG